MNIGSNVSASDKYTKTNKTTKVQNKIVKNQKLSDLIVEAFNLYYADQPYFLVLTPFDNDITLNDYILLPDKDFISLLKEFQEKYNIYKFGYNIFKDGNIIYILNKKTPGKLEMFNDWHYTFIIKSEEKENLRGMYPYQFYEKDKSVEVYIPYSHIELVGDVTIDESDVQTTILITPKGTKIKSDEEVKTTFTKVINISHEVNKDGSNKTIIKHSPKTYQMMNIKLSNSFLTFMPGDEITIKNHENPDYNWKGTVKRWNAQIKGQTRQVFLVVVGSVEDAEIKGLFSNIAKALGLPPALQKFKMKDLEDGINKVQKVTNDYIDKATKLADSVDKFVDQVDALPGKVMDTIGKHVTGYLDGKITDFIDEHIGKELFNDIMDYTQILYNSPLLQPYIQKGWTKVTEFMDKKINDVIDRLFLPEEVLKDKIYLERLQALRNKYVDISEDISVNEVSFQEMYDNYYFFADGFDRVVNSKLLKDIVENTGIWYKHIEKLNLTEKELLVLKFDILYNTRHENIRRYHPDTNIHKFITKIRQEYKDTLTDNNVESYKYEEPKIDNEFITFKDDIKVLVIAVPVIMEEINKKMGVE